MKKPVNLFLMRHGNTFESTDTPVQVGLKSDLTLTEKGRSQAIAMRDHLVQQNITLDAIYTGYLQRQTESGRIIAEPFHLTPQKNEALNEIDYGQWEGLTPEAIKNVWPELHTEWEKASRWPNEIFEGTLDEHISKIGAWLDHLRQNAEAHENVLAVSSNGIIRLFLYFSNLDWISLTENQTLGEYKVKTGHFCKLVLHETGLEIESWNQPA